MDYEPRCISFLTRGFASPREDPGALEPHGGTDADAYLERALEPVEV